MQPTCGPSWMRDAFFRSYAAILRLWRCPGETAGNFRNVDKSGGNRITCWLSDTTEEYHRQSCDTKLK